MDLGGDLRTIAAKVNRSFHDRCALIVHSPLEQVSQLEIEQGQVREALAQARNQVKTLERRNQSLEQENAELVAKVVIGYQ